MYIIPKDRPEPYDYAHVICFLGVTKFVHQGAKKLLFLALAQLTDKIYPMYIIPKDRPEPHDDFMFHLFFGCYQIWPPGGQKTAFLGSSSADRQDGPHVYYTKNDWLLEYS